MEIVSSKLVQRNKTELKSRTIHMRTTDFLQRYEATVEKEESFQQLDIHIQKNEHQSIVYHK